MSEELSVMKLRSMELDKDAELKKQKFYLLSEISENLNPIEKHQKMK